MNGKRILAVAAHPDDADFYCGGAVAKWIEEGAEVCYVICTDGAMGSESGDITPEELIRIRIEEQRSANKELGVKETVFLGYPDMGLTAGEELREKICREIRRLKPHILLTFDPWQRYELHPDHTVAGREAIYSRLAARLPLKYPGHSGEGLKAWSIQDMYLFKTDRPNFWVETETQLKKKLNALASHKSQFSALALDTESGMEILLQMSQRHPETGVISEGFRRIALEGLEGLKNYIGLY